MASQAAILQRWLLRSAAAPAGERGDDVGLRASEPFYITNYGFIMLHITNYGFTMLPARVAV